MLKSFGEIGPASPEKNENAAQQRKNGCDGLKMTAVGIVFTAMSESTQQVSVSKFFKYFAVSFGASILTSFS